MRKVSQGAIPRIRRALRSELSLVSDDLIEHVPRVYRFTLRLTGDPHRADDLTQETFLRAWKKRHTLNEKRAVLGWLFRIAANLWRDELRRQPAPAHSLEGDTPQISAPPGQDLEHREERSRILRWLDSLPPRQREVLYLRAVEDFSLDEICDVLQISKGAAKTNLSLARKAMRENFQLTTRETDR